MFRRTHFAFFARAVFALTLHSHYTEAQSPTSSPCKSHLKVGVVLPLSGGPVSAGQAVQRSILLASEKYDPSACVKFFFEDDQLVPKNTVSAVTKLLNIDQINSLIVCGTGTSLAVADIAEQRHLPMIALSILGKVVAGRSYVVKHWCTAERLNEAVSAEVSRRGYKTIAIASTINDAMLGLRDLFLKTNPQLVILNEEFAKDDYSFESFALHVRREKPDAVYVLMFPPQAAPFMKTLRTAKYSQDAFGVHNIEDPNEIKASEGSMIGMWFANGDDGAGENYRADYTAKYSEPPVFGGANAFDVAKLLIEAAQHGVDPNVYLHSVKNFSGAFGSYDATGNNDFNFKAVIKEVTETGLKKREP